MATPQSVAFHTLGCKLNYSETSSIQRQFEDHGYSISKFENGADIYVINTCSVTDFADRKCRKIVRDALRYAPQAKIVMIGCYAQLKPEEIANIPGVDLVLGAAEKFNVLNYIDSLAENTEKGMIVASDVRSANSFTEAFSFGDRTRSFLKVQDGCDYKCSFCTIPQARGASRSDTIKNVIQNAKKIADQGIKEIVLTGVNIGDFNDGKATFLDLIRALDEVDSLERIRISSIEPNLCNDAIIKFVSESQRLVPHFHMPLQSGSNKILKLMKRRYLRELYQERVQKIKYLMPHCCIGVDVIVGFPGESDTDFLETVHFLDSLDISYLHVFTYSERENTPAASMNDAVPMNVRRKRNEILRSLSEKKRRAFYRKHLYTAREVLFEPSGKEGVMSGFTDNYIKIEMPLNDDLLQKTLLVNLDKIGSSGDVAVSHLAENLIL